MIHEITVMKPYEAFNWLRYTISEKGDVVESRGKKFKEIIQVFVEILKPEYCTIPIESYNEDFIIQETQDILTGKPVSAIHSEEMLEYTMGDPKAKFFYGEEVREALSSWSLDKIQRLFEDDINTRKAVLDLGNRFSKKHIPCFTFAHFMIRENKLNCTVETRSTDLAFGFPYDVFLFSTVQRILLRRLKKIKLDLTLGTLCYKSISMHYYVNESNEPLKDLKYKTPLHSESFVSHEFIEKLDKLSTFRD
jgi:thymidylate synthase